MPVEIPEVCVGENITQLRKIFLSPASYSQKNEGVAAYLFATQAQHWIPYDPHEAKPKEEVIP